MPSIHHTPVQSLRELIRLPRNNARDGANKKSSCTEVVDPGSLFGRLAQQTTGHVRADVHLRPTKRLCLPSGQALKVKMPHKPRGTLLMDFENLGGKLRLVAGSLELRQPITVKRLGDLSGAHGLRRFLFNKMASYELSGFKIDSTGRLTPQGTVLIAHRLATRRFANKIPTFNLGTMAGHGNFKEDGLSKGQTRSVRTLLSTISSGNFKIDTKSRLGEEVLLDASKIALGNETYINIARTAISGDVQGKFRTNANGVVIDLCPPKRAGDRTVSCNTAEVDLRAHVEARLEQRGPDKRNVMGIGIYASDAVASVRHLDLGLRGEPAAPTNSGRLVGGTAWRPCKSVPAVVVTLDHLEAFAPDIGAVVTRGRIDADAALSFVEPVDPDNVLAAHTRGLQLAYDGKLDALGDITFTQPSGDPSQPPAKMVQHVKYVRGVNKSSEMEPLPDDAPVDGEPPVTDIRAQLYVQEHDRQGGAA